MALATYGDLKTSVAAWLARADLTSVIPDFVTLTHADLMRDLRGHLRLQKRDTAFSIATEYVACPTDFLELVSLIVTSTNPPYAINFLPNDKQVDMNGATTGTPKWVAVVGATNNTENFRFSPPPGQTLTATIEYYARLTFFANDAATNWVLTDYPNLYLFGALYHGYTYLQNPQSADQMKSRYDQHLGQLIQAGRRARWGANGMQVRPG